MNITITIQELYDMGLLDKFCEVMKIPEASALASPDKYELTYEQAVAIGIVPRTASKPRKYHLTHHDDEIAKSEGV